jgi:hypothetical protein
MTGRWVVLFAAALVSGCATGGRVSTPALEHVAPAGYRPAVPVTVAYAPARELPDVCELEPDRLVGCSKLWPGDRCEIIIAEGLGAQLTKEVLEHEKAHCAGWSHEDD